MTLDGTGACDFHARLLHGVNDGRFVEMIKMIMCDRSATDRLEYYPVEAGTDINVLIHPASPPCRTNMDRLQQCIVY
jgi:hypothetical protein